VIIQIRGVVAVRRLVPLLEASVDVELQTIAEADVLDAPAVVSDALVGSLAARLRVS
jgi:hypothetical protein